MTRHPLAAATTRAELILAQARRARTPDEVALVGKAVAGAAKTATAEEMDLLDAARAAARETMDAYLSGRVRRFERRAR